MKVKVTFNFGLDATPEQVNETNWKKQIMSTYTNCGNDSDYDGELREAIVDELSEDEIDDELIDFIYEDASLSNLLACMTLKSMQCIENNADNCIMEFTVLFDAELLDSEEE